MPIFNSPEENILSDYVYTVITDTLLYFHATHTHHRLVGHGFRFMSEISALTNHGSPTVFQMSPRTLEHFARSYVAYFCYVSHSSIP